MSNGPEFFQTVMGHKFYEADVPRALKALERIANALERQEAPKQVIEAPVDPSTRLREAHHCNEPSCPDNQNAREARSIAKQLYEQDGEIEFDDDAKVSLIFNGEGDVTGAYVQAWTYVEFAVNQKKGDE